MKCETEAAFQMAWAVPPGARHNTVGANTEVPDRRSKRKWAQEKKSFQQAKSLLPGQFLKAEQTFLWAPRVQRGLTSTFRFEPEFWFRLAFPEQQLSQVKPLGIASCDNYGNKETY